MKPSEYNKILTRMIDQLPGLREIRPSAGRAHLVMYYAADTAELADGLTQEVLARVKREIVLDADEGIDYAALAEALQPLLPVELKWPTDGEAEACAELNDKLDKLLETLLGIADELTRHRKDDEYVRLYESELKIFIKNSSRRARQDYENWREKQCLGSPSLEELEEYRADKLMKMFETGVFEERVSHMTSARHFVGEVVFDGLMDGRKIAAKDVHKYYCCLRKICDYKNGLLTVNPKQAGIHFYANREEKNAKQRRTSLLKNLYKVELAQQDMQALRSRRGIRLSALPDSRKAILESLTELVGYGEWVAPATAENVLAMLQNVLGVGMYELTGEDAERSETLWSLLEATGKLRVVWQNLTGYFAEKRFFNPSFGSPALNEMFFGNTEYYQNIDKGRPSYNRKSRKWTQVLPLLDRFVPRKE